MLDNYKKYIPHLISVLFLLNGILVFVLKNSPAVILFGFLVIIFGLAVIGESLYNIVKSREEDVPINPIITYPLLIIFGVFYNPCFSLKYFDGDQDYKKKNIIFLVVTVALSIILLVLFVNNRTGWAKLSNEVTSVNQDTSMKIPDGYGEEEVGGADLAYTDGDHHIVLRKNTTASSAENFIKVQKEDLKSGLKEFTILSDDTKTIKDKTIREIAISGKVNNESYVYVIATVKSSNVQGKFISIYQYCYESSYDSYKKTMDKIIESAEVK